jgi:hypothetical protein
MNAVQIAYRAWRNDLARQGDPIRRPNLSFDAFSAGYTAGERWTSRLHLRINSLNELDNRPQEHCGHGRIPKGRN